MFASSDPYPLQRLSPEGTENLLDHHSAVIDGWLQAQLLPWVSFSLSSFLLLSYFLAAVTLVDLLDPEEFNWERFSLITQDEEAAANLIHLGRALTAPVNLFDGTVSRTAYLLSDSV